MIEFNNTEHGWLIAEAIPRTYNEKQDVVISHTLDGKLLGGVIFDGFTGPCIFAHQAGFDKRWLTRDMLWMIFDYPFNQLEVKKICGTIPASDKSLLEFNTKLGFKVEASIADAYPTGDMLVMSMKKDECRWLNVKPRGWRGRDE